MAEQEEDQGLLRRRPCRGPPRWRPGSHAGGRAWGFPTGLTTRCDNLEEACPGGLVEAPFAAMGVPPFSPTLDVLIQGTLSKCPGPRGHCLGDRLELMTQFVAWGLFNDIFYRQQSEIV